MHSWREIDSSKFKRKPVYAGSVPEMVSIVQNAVVMLESFHMATCLESKTSGAFWLASTTSVLPMSYMDV